jgi:hypothetical protein
MSPQQAYAVEHSHQPPPSTASPAPMAAADRIAMLEQLHADGTLTDEEFRSLRDRIES